MRLQTKFLALLLPAGCAAAALILFLTGRSVHAVLFNELTKNAVLLAEAAADDAPAGFESRSEARLLPLLQALQKQESAVYAAALDPKGVVLAHTTIKKKGSVQKDPFTLTALSSDRSVASTSNLRGEPVVEVAVPVWRAAPKAAEESFLLSGDQRAAPKTRLGVLKVGVPLSAARQTESKIERQIVLIVLAIGCAALGCALLLVRGILRPVTSLMDGIASIGRGRYDVKVPVQTRDELGDLAQSFNSMSAVLARTTVSKEYVENILENMADFLIVTDPQGRIETINRATLEGLSYSASELANRPLSSLLADRQDFPDSPSAEAVRDREVTLETKSGRLIPALLSASMSRDRHGDLRGWICIIKDITERKQKEEEMRLLHQSIRDKNALLEEQNRAIQAATRHKSEFLANMSHELRTPLNAVIGFSEIIIDGKAGPISPTQKEFLGDILNGGRQLLQLVNDVLDLSKIEAGKMDLLPEPFPVRETVEEVVSLLRPLAAKKRLTVRTRVDDAVGTVTLDRKKFKQILFNLLSNAVKFSNETGAVEVAVSRPASRLEMRVADSGIGISKEDLPRLFLEFQQLDSGTTRRQEGTGLGLALCRRMAELQNGSITAESEPGKGSVFTVVLPVS